VLRRLYPAALCGDEYGVYLRKQYEKYGRIREATFGLMSNSLIQKGASAQRSVRGP
jgi:hypothetical protein